jgi:hypothetical protein
MGIMKNQIKAFFHNYSLIFLGFLLFTLYFWNRFLRSRTSKDLPLNLSILYFFTLVYICLIFGYIAYSLRFPRKSNDLVEKLTEFLFTPIAEFDKFLKSLPKIRLFFTSTLYSFLPKLNYLIIQTNLLYIFLWIIPRLLLLFVFYLDIRYFKRFHYKYYFVFLGIFIFLHRYLKYSLKTYKIELFEEGKLYIQQIETPYVPKIHPAELEPNYDPDEEDYIENMFLPFEIFIKFQIESIIKDGITRKIVFTTPTMLLYEKLWAEHIGEPYRFYSSRKEIPKDYKNIFGDKIPENYRKARSLIWKKENEFIRQKIKNIVDISILYEHYNEFSNNNEKIKKIKFYIYLNYFLCWLYVLIISLPTLNIIELFETLNKMWLTIPNPF